MAVPILKDPPITMREALIPYAMVGVNMLAPVLAAYDVLGQMPLVFPMAVAMVLLGLPVSIYFRQRRYNRIVLNLLTMVPLLILTWTLTHTHPGLQFDWNNLLASIMSIRADEEMDGLLMVFALLACGRAFLLVSPVDMLQTPLPSFSLFLLATISSNLHFYPLEHIFYHMIFSLCCFLLLSMSTLYLFCLEQSQHWFSIHPPLRFQRRLILWTTLFSLLSFPVVVGLGWSLRSFNMNVLRRAQNQSPSNWQPFWAPRKFTFSFGDNIDMKSPIWSHGKQNMMKVKVKGKYQNSLLWRARTYSFYDYDQRKKQWLSDAQAPDSSVESNPEKMAQAGNNWITEMHDGAQRGTFRPDSLFSDPGLAEAIKEHLINPNNAAEQVIQTFDLQAKISDGPEQILGLYQIYQVSPVTPSNEKAVEVAHKPASPNSRRRTFKDTIDRMKVSEDGSISLTRPDPLFSTYQIISVAKQSPPMLHLTADPVLPDRDKYLQMPPTTGTLGNSYIPGKTESMYANQFRRKALEILAEGHLTENSKAFEKVNQLENYLGKHYRYTLAPDPPKYGIDPIINFLFYQQRGYCTYFSGAMVMLCRSIGLPARMVTGFAAGEALENTNNPAGTTYQVTSDDAHCWVEVFLPHYGWCVMDPTSGSKQESSLLIDAWDNIIAFVNSIKTQVTSAITAVRKHAAARRNALLIFLGLEFVIAGIFYLRRERPPTLPRHTLSDDQARHSVLASYQRMHRWLRLWGVIKPDGATALEFEQLFREMNPPMGEMVGQLTRLYLRSRYSAHSTCDADARQAITLLQELWHLAPSERKHFYGQAEE